MKTFGDLKSFVDHFKNKRNELQAPMIRKGLVFYIHTNIASQRLENTRVSLHQFFSTLLEAVSPLHLMHCGGQYVILLISVMLNEKKETFVSIYIIIIIYLNLRQQVQYRID